ncbi:hypothetical protein BGY98DRAFT_201365 [Russula aff. rugulosa BPL654]|nr:hypothetical protein BGY98DRAFT_201365 [Russula aff. rugulosa BPL654]
MPAAPPPLPDPRSPPAGPAFPEHRAPPTNAPPLPEPVPPPLSESLFSPTDNVTTISSINLPGSSTEAYPATELVKYLIDAVGRDVMSFRRNAQVSYLLVDRTRDIFHTINAYIQRTESGEDWDSYDKFTNAIDPIEEALFALIAYTEDEKARHLISGTTVEDCVTSTEVWANNREGLWKALDSLESKPELTELFYGLDAASRLEDRKEARRHDDESFFEEVVGDIKDAFKSQRRLPSTISNVHANLTHLLDKMTEGSIFPWLTVFSMKTALLVQGIVNLSMRLTQTDRATRNHLKSKSVWEAAEQLTTLLNSTLGDDKVSMNQVRHKYDAFVMLLFNTTELPPPKSYLELMKQAARVRRPFNAQALAIIQLCRTLVNKFKEESHHTADNILPLEDACDEALKALQAAAGAVTELKIFDMAKFEDHAARKVINKAKEQIKTCFDTFGLGDAWSEHERLLYVAVEKDKKRMEDLNRVLTTRPPLRYKRGLHSSK